MKQTQLKIAYVSPASPCIQRLVAKDEFLLNSASSFKPLRHKTYLSGRGLLKLALVEQGLLDINAPLPPLKLGPSGKPFIGTLSKSVNEVHFNLSHSIDLIALSTGSKDQGINLEVANIKRLRKPLVERVLSDKELDYYLKLESDADKALFFTQQSEVSEALIKLTGLSIFKMDVLILIRTNTPLSQVRFQRAWSTASSYQRRQEVQGACLAKLCTIATHQVQSACLAKPCTIATHQVQSACLAKLCTMSRPSSVTVDANCGLDEPLEINLNEPLDAMVSVFVHQEDVRMYKRAGLRQF